MYKSFKNYGVKSIKGITPNTPYIKPKYKTIKPIQPKQPNLKIKGIKPIKPAKPIDIGNFVKTGLYDNNIQQVFKENYRSFSEYMKKQNSNVFKKEKKITEQIKKTIPLNYYSTTIEIKKQIEEIKEPIDMPSKYNEFYEKWKEYIEGTKSIKDYIRSYNVAIPNSVLNYLDIYSDDKIINIPFGHILIYVSTIGTFLFPNACYTIRRGETIPNEQMLKKLEFENLLYSIVIANFTKKINEFSENANNNIYQKNFVFTELRDVLDSIARFNNEDISKLISSINNISSKMAINILGGSVIQKILTKITPLSTIISLATLVLSFIKENKLKNALYSSYRVTDSYGKILSWEEIDKKQRENLIVIMGDKKTAMETHEAIKNYFIYLQYYRLTELAKKIDEYWKNWENGKNIFEL